jgi:hypothetical protein
MDYLVNNKKSNKNKREDYEDHVEKVIPTQKTQNQSNFYRPNSASTLRTFNTGFLFNVQATTTS